MRWDRDGADWPNREMSRFIAARPHRWHVQIAGDGPVVLLLHGTGGATHSWRDILPLLTRHCTVVAPDLPGHGFTNRGSANRSSLDAMTEDLEALCDTLALRPDLIVGHSAGGALALNMALRRDDPPPVIGLNAAIGGFDGVAAWLFPAMARGLATLPFSATAIASGLSIAGSAPRLLASTGSRIDRTGVALYQRLLSDPEHVAGALAMMSQWSLRRLIRALPEHRGRVLLLAGARDGTVPPAISRDAAERLPEGQARILDDLGHLAHEEAPQFVADIIVDALAPATPRR